MNHPKGEESTGAGERCSGCPQQLCSAAEPAPTNCGTAAGADIYRSEAYAAGLAPFLLRESETRLAVLIGGAERYPPDRADRNDHLLFRDRHRQEAVAGLARERQHRQPLAVCELHLDVGAFRRMGRRVLLDLAVNARDEIVERRLRRTRDPEVGAQKSFASAAASAAAPTWARPSAVITRPRGVRCRKPSCSRYGSYTSSIVSGSSPSATASVERPTGPPSNFSTTARSSARSVRSRPCWSTSSSSSASRAMSVVIAP